MANEELRAKIRDLFIETGRAHHKAFEATDGEDPDWPVWYAGYVRERLSALLDTPFTKSQLVDCLMFVELERQTRNPDAEWAAYYADHLLERFAASPAPVQDSLALYYFPQCGYCSRVLRALDGLDVDAELRDIHENPEHWDALVAARGRATVPVLRITSPDGEERWMPESLDIVQYLERTYG